MGAVQQAAAMQQAPVGEWSNGFGNGAPLFQGQQWRPEAPVGMPYGIPLHRGLQAHAAMIPMMDPRSFPDPMALTGGHGRTPSGEDRSGRSERPSGSRRSYCATWPH